MKIAIQLVDLYMSDSNEPTTLVVPELYVRSLLFVASLGYTAFGLVSIYYSDFQDPIVFRLFISLLFAGLLVSSFFSKTVIQEIASIMSIIIFPIATHFTYLLYINELSSIAIVYNTIFLSIATIVVYFILKNIKVVVAFVSYIFVLNVILSIIFFNNENSLVHLTSVFFILLFVPLTYLAMQRLNSQLVTSQSYLNSIISNSPQIYCLLDSNAKILQWSYKPFMDNLVERYPVHKNLISLFNNIDEVRDSFETANSGLAVRQRITLSDKILEFIYEPLYKSEDDGDRQIVLLIFDLTDIIRAEESMEKQKQSLIEIQKLGAVGRLASGIAHDFNNVLSVISLSSYVLEHRWHDITEEEKLDLLGEIQYSIEKANFLTNRLSGFSRTEPYNPKIIDLNSSVTDFSKAMMRLIKGDISLKVNSYPKHVFVEFDEGELEQILLNLVLNARDAITGKGKITIKIGQPPENDLYLEDYWELSVEDDGEGIDDEIQDRIFEPFFTTKEIGKGTGLGLYTVKTIVDKNGGNLKVFSTKGKGTTLRIYIPKIEGGTPLEIDPTQSPISTKDQVRTVLLVEDEEKIRKMLDKVLATEKYLVLSADNGKSALDLSNSYEGTIDILISDIMMPKMNGLDLSLRIKLQRPDIKIILISGYPIETTKQLGEYHEDYTYLRKPFTIKELIEHLTS